jgi:hypothetical protein
MITPCTPARLARLGLALSALVALLLAWTRTGEEVPEDSPVRACHDLLELGLAQLLARDRLKLSLEADVAAGRLPLREAARRFRDHLERETRLGVAPTGRDCAALLLPGASLEEQCANWLLREVRKRRSGEPGGAERVARLERELVEAYGNVAAPCGVMTNRTPRLPD